MEYFVRQLDIIYGKIITPNCTLKEKKTQIINLNDLYFRMDVELEDLFKIKCEIWKLNIHKEMIDILLEKGQETLEIVDTGKIMGFLRDTCMGIDNEKETIQQISKSIKSELLKLFGDNFNHISKILIEYLDIAVHVFSNEKLIFKLMNKYTIEYLCVTFNWMRDVIKSNISYIVIISLFIQQSRPALVLLCSDNYSNLIELLENYIDKAGSLYVNKLIKLLNSGKIKITEENNLHNNSAKIQSIIRGFISRCKLKKQKESCITIQRYYRYNTVFYNVKFKAWVSKVGNIVPEAINAVRERILWKHKSENAKKLNKEKYEKNLEFYFNVNMKCRNLNSKIYRNMVALKPMDIREYMDNLKNDAAIIIQKFWRGYITRKSLHFEKNCLLNIKAAIIRKFLHLRVTKKSNQDYILNSESWYKKLVIDENKMNALEQELKQMDDIHVLVHKTPQMKLNLHDRTQQMLRQRAINSRIETTKYKSRLCMVDSVNKNIEVLKGLPKLSQVTKENYQSIIKLFYGNSKSIEMRAKLNHNQKYRHLINEKIKNTYETDTNQS
ncbi:IQ calmodulin-binding motif-containing protein 1 [Intoshia linei]|uniref:IQ calmodulin-binding motif-containing protein 1 n=1 Tax=Intoshia linei TaxID=1819745 RepID=A0A177B4Y6_9BILA|nr:IQ calmodulin-binding motif-containing protein 1 [Intoshia linei]